MHVCELHLTEMRPQVEIYVKLLDDAENSAEKEIGRAAALVGSLTA